MPFVYHTVFNFVKNKIFLWKYQGTKTDIFLTFNFEETQVKHKDCLRKKMNADDMQMIPPYGREEEELKSLLWKWKKRAKKLA